MTQSVPRRSRVDTSVTARVGRAFRIMESSICVAVITGLPASLHLRISIFWAKGTSSGFHAQVAPGDHDAVSRLDDIINVPEALSLSILAMTCWLPPASRMYSRTACTWSAAHKGSSDKIDSVLHAEANVPPVFGGHRRKGNVYAGQALPCGCHLTSHNHLAVHIVSRTSRTTSSIKPSSM